MASKKKKKRKSHIVVRTILLLVLLLVLVALVYSGGDYRKIVNLVQGKATVTQRGGNSSVPEASSDAASTAISIEEEPSAESNASSTGNANLLNVPENMTEQQALDYAARYAQQYDYDKAISLLQNYQQKTSSDAVTKAIDEYTKEKADCVAVDVNNVPHVFFHSLINDDRGFKTEVVGKERAWQNDTAMVSSDEFDHIINDMYKAGYVMVSLDDLCVKTKQPDGSVSIAPNTNLMLPKGKKAFVLSEDDLSYYHSYGIGTQGYATKMVLNKKGEVKCVYTDENGKTHVGNYDVVPRMNAFIEKHPDFSYHNHKGTVALTGYDGVFGYRTNDYYKDINNPNLSQDQVQWLKDHPKFNWYKDVNDAKKIADAMKADGWTFASHTYAHWNATTKSVADLKADNERWMNVNHPIVGDTDKIIFAFGGDIGGVADYNASNPKYAYFKSAGYNIFCNVDGNIGWTQFGNGYMRQGRVALDGFTMYQAITPSGRSHATYAHDYEVLGVKNIESFFNKFRITPIDSE